MTAQAPDLPPELEHIRRLPPSGESLELAAAVVEAELPITARRVRVRECELRGVAFDAGTVHGLDLVDATLTDCDLSNVDARDGHLRRVAIVRSRMVGLSLSGGGVRDLAVTQCSLELASFASAGLEDVVFQDVNLTDASFQQARLRRVQFVGCRLAGADFRGARLTDCALSGGSLEGVVGVGALRGLRMPWPDVVASAGALADALGIEIED